MNRLVQLYRRFSPPGIAGSTDVVLLAAGIPVAAIFCYCSFSVKYDRALTDLNNKLLWKDDVMPPFGELFKGCLSGFGALVLLILVWIVFRYVFFHRESKSIYLMRRLPKRSELYKRLLVIPAIYLILCLLSAIVMLFICRAVYMNLTPAELLPADPWI